MNFYERFIERVYGSIEDERKRKKVQFELMYGILGGATLMMAIINFIGKTYLLGSLSLAFSIMCMLCYQFSKRRDTLPITGVVIFTCFAYVLFLMITLRGSADSFSVIWLLLFPSIYLEIYGKRIGTVLTFILMSTILFLFWTPAGELLLRGEYGMSFKIKFTMLFSVTYVFSLMVESVRSLTYRYLVAEKERNQYLSMHDALTDTFNRTGFYEAIAPLQPDMDHNGVSLIMVDVDHYKQINDTYGHMTGDKVLRSLAQQIKQTVGDQGIICRWGGDEFIVLFLHDVDGKLLAEQIRKEIEAHPIAIDETTIHLTVSIGYVLLEPKALSIDAIISEADNCMYDAKQQGRNTVITKNL